MLNIKQKDKKKQFPVTMRRFWSKAMEKSLKRQCDTLWRPWLLFLRFPLSPNARSQFCFFFLSFSFIHLAAFNLFVWASKSKIHTLTHATLVHCTNICISVNARTSTRCEKKRQRTSSSIITLTFRQNRGKIKLTAKERTT